MVKDNRNRGIGFYRKEPEPSNAENEDDDEDEDDYTKGHESLRNHTQRFAYFGLI
jgi:hypothetical protein